MGKKNFTALIIFIALLAVSILLMGVSLLLSERAFARVSSYIAIACVVITLIVILLAVSVFLISNTITTGIAVRREEIAIMKYIGATNLFVRMPFVLEGIIIGIIGAAIPLFALYFLYQIYLQ